MSSLSREIEELRGPPPIPSQPPPPPMSVATTRAVLARLLEAITHHVALGEFDDARRKIGEAILRMGEIRDPGLVARASLHIGEALIPLDAPKHAKERFEIAIKTFDETGEAQLATRARVGLGRVLHTLEDPTSVDVLMEAKRAFFALGDAAGTALVDAVVKELHGPKPAAQPRIEMGHTRPVSVRPPTK